MEGWMLSTASCSTHLLLCLRIKICQHHMHVNVESCLNKSLAHLNNHSVLLLSSYWIYSSPRARGYQQGKTVRCIQAISILPCKDGGGVATHNYTPSCVPSDLISHAGSSQHRCVSHPSWFPSSQHHRCAGNHPLDRALWSNNMKMVNCKRQNWKRRK